MASPTPASDSSVLAIRPDPRGVASQVGAVDTERLSADTIRRGNLEMVRRTAPGTWMYALLVGIVAIWSDMALDHPAVLISVGAGQVLLAICRTLLTRRYPTLYQRSPERARLYFAITVLAAGATWGGFVAYAIAMYGTAWTTLLVMLCTAGIMAGGTTALCLRRALHTWWLVFMCVPLIVVCLVHTKGGGIPFAGMATLYVLFLMREARYLNRSFWRSLQKSQLIEREHERKRRFLASVTHEIRTPMTCVLGLLQLVRDDPRHPATAERLETIDRSSRELLRLVNELLEAPNVDEPKAEILCAPFNLRACVDEVARLVHPTAADKGLPVVVAHGEGLPKMVVGDRGRIRQVLLNILHNAVRFTESGRIELHTGMGRGLGQGSWLEISVQDTGVGMSPEMVRYALGDSERYGDDDGRMGLRISSYLMRRMGGTLVIESGTPREGEAQGPGTRVVLGLPYVEAVGAAPSDEAATCPAATPPSDPDAAPVRAEEPAPQAREPEAGDSVLPGAEPQTPFPGTTKARPGHIILVGGEERETRRMQAALELGGHHVSWVEGMTQVQRLLGAHPARAHAVLFLTPAEPRSAGEAASELRRALGSKIGHIAMLATAWNPEETLSDSIGFKLDDIVTRDPAQADVSLEVAEAIERRRLRSGGRAGLLVGRMFM